MIKNDISEKKMSSKEMLDDLNKDLGNINKLHNNVVADRGHLSGQVEVLRQQFIEKLFDLLKENGVDPTDLASINKFLQKLEQSDPDLAEIFDSAFTSLTDENSLPSPTTQAPLESSELPNKYSSLMSNIKQPMGGLNENEVII